MTQRLFLFIGLLVLSAPAGAAVPGPSQLCRGAVVSAEAAERIPARLLEAIARVESGRKDPRSGQVHPWPWTINAEGEGYFFDTKGQAIAAVKALQARGVASIDVGCMQVNLMHHPHAFASLDSAFDPHVNARYAAKFLNELYSQTHSWPRSTGLYHSQTLNLATSYQRRVMVEWERPNGWAQFGAFGGGQAFRAIAPAEERYRSFVPQADGFAAFPRVR